MRHITYGSVAVLLFFLELIIENHLNSDGVLTLTPIYRKKRGGGQTRGLSCLWLQPSQSEGYNNEDYDFKGSKNKK